MEVYICNQQSHYFSVPIVDFYISINKLFTNLGSFSSSKSFRNLYCITLCRYKHILETKVLLYIVIRNIIVIWNGLIQVSDIATIFNSVFKLFRNEVSCKK